MGMIKGQKEYEKFERGEKLSRKQAILAHCYQCNGFEESNEDCQGTLCPMYQYSPSKGKKRGKRTIKAEISEQVEIGA